MTVNNKAVIFQDVIKKYTLFFVIYSSVCVILFFLISRTSMFTMADGIYQQYVYFIYSGKWIRGLFSNIFVKHVFEIPMWDMSIGMGADSLITLSAVAYPLTDPLYWISAVVPIKAAEYVFDLILLVKLYLSGAAYSFFAYSKKIRTEGIIAGAMIYTFSSVVYIGFTQGYFFNVFYLFPLLMVGVDRLWKKEGYRLYVLILAACVMYSYYFTYMMGLLIVFYCVFRFICDKQMHSVKQFGSVVGRFVGYTILGAFIGVGFQLPAIMNLAGLDRLNLKGEIALVSPKSIGNLLCYAFSNGSIGHEGFMGVSSLVLIAVILLFSEHGKHFLLKLLFVLYTISFAVPFVGNLFNGFSFPTGRYIFGYVLLLAYIVSFEFERILQIRIKPLIVCLCISVADIIVALVCSDVMWMLSGLSILIITTTLGIIRYKSKISEQVRFISVMIGILITCFIIGFAHIYVYLVAAEMPLGTCYDYLLDSNGVKLMNEEEYNELDQIRFDYVPFVIDDVPLNSSMLLDINGYDFYNSNYNNDLDKYYDKMAIISNPLGYMYNGMRGRNYLELMNGTRYITTQADKDMGLSSPYSYSFIRDDNEYALYESSSDTSLVYYYDDALSEDVLEQIDPIEAEELMMSYCLLENEPVDHPVMDQHEVVDYSIIDSHGISKTGDNTFYAEPKSYILLETDDMENCEISIYFDGINADLFYVTTVSLGNDQSVFSYEFFEGRAENDMYYHWKDTFVANFGYVEKTVNRIKIGFNNAGNYSLNDIRIYTRNEDQLTTTVGRFYEHADIDDINYEIAGNHINISADADHDKYLYLAVPYSKGWSASIDGEKTEIMKANIAFMAIPITSGTHTVELTYRTPYIGVSVFITGAALIVFIALMIIDKRRKSQYEKS